MHEFLRSARNDFSLFNIPLDSLFFSPLKVHKIWVNIQSFKTIAYLYDWISLAFSSSHSSVISVSLLRFISTMCKNRFLILRICSQYLMHRCFSNSLCALARRKSRRIDSDFDLFKTFKAIVNELMQYRKVF